ncbi:MAG: DUF502 domain-containing protein [Candidatus Binatia bacterium]
MMLKERLRRYFFAGLLVLLPLVITVWLLGWIIGLMDGLLDILPASVHPSTYLPFAVPGLGALITLLLILFLGFLATGVFTRRALRVWDGFLIRIPVFRGVYTSVQKLVETIFSQEQDGRRVVLFEYPRKGIFTVGFATGYAAGELAKHSEDRLVNIFVPTTPNPTSGFYLLVPEREIVTLEMTPEEAFKLIVSGGMISPEEKTILVSSK